MYPLSACFAAFSCILIFVNDLKAGGWQHLLNTFCSSFTKVNELKLQIIWGGVLFLMAGWRSDGTQLAAQSFYKPSLWRPSEPILYVSMWTNFSGVQFFFLHMPCNMNRNRFIIVKFDFAVQIQICQFNKNVCRFSTFGSARFIFNCLEFIHIFFILLYSKENMSLVVEMNIY